MATTFFRYDIQGWQQVLAGHKLMLREMRPGGAFGRLIFDLAFYGRDMAESLTHEDTQALKHSHRVNFSSNGIDFRGPEAHIYIVPIVNPLTGLLTTEYAGIEEGRGGEHAFYNRTITEGWGKISSRALGNFEKDFFRV